MRPESLHLNGIWKASADADRQRRLFATEACDTTSWADITVPGHWSTDASFAGLNGPVLYRRTFGAPESSGRHWLTFDGVWDRAIVWMNGSYLGEVEGYFAPKAFDISRHLRTDAEHILAVEVERRKSPWDSKFNPAGGLWSNVRVDETGDVRIARCKVLCTEASADRAILSISTELDVVNVEAVRIQTTVKKVDGTTLSSAAFTRPVALGNNRVKWTAIVEDAPLWWPATYGSQELVDVEIEVWSDGEFSDAHQVRSGLRHAARENSYLFVNGERVYMRGVAPLAPMTRLSVEPSTAVLGDIADSGANVIEVGPWVENASFYAEADERGILVAQSLPELSGAEKASGRLARQAVEVLGHHPSVVAWVRPPIHRPTLARLFSRHVEDSPTVDSSRPVLDRIEPWFFDQAGDEAVAALVAKWSRRARVLRFRSQGSDAAAVIDELRRAKYDPLGGFIAEDVDTSDLGEAMKPVTVVIHHLTSPQPGRVWHGEVLVVNDSAERIDDTVAALAFTVGDKKHAWEWRGNIAADSVATVGRFRVIVPLTAIEVKGEASLRSPSVESVRPLAIPLV